MKRQREDTDPFTIKQNVNGTFTLYDGIGEATVSIKSNVEAAVLETIYITPENRGKGNGTIFWQKIISFLQSKGVKNLSLWANPTWYKDSTMGIDQLVNWYKNRGAKVVKYAPNDPFGITGPVKMEIADINLPVKRRIEHFVIM